MSAIDHQDLGAFRPKLAALKMLSSACVFVGVFLSGFVISEPAPYELYMAAMIGLWFLFGLPLSRLTGTLLALLLLFNLGCLLSLTQMKDLADGPMYLGVSLFLGLSAVFYAAIIEDGYQRLPVMFNAWVFSALITSILGILGYFHAFPGSEVFTLYDRAKGAFQDPNVFGPFLIAPSLYLLYGILTGRLVHLPIRMGSLAILALGILLSFSRAAWALYVFSMVALVFVMMLKERSGAFRLKILILSLIGLILMVAILLIALQFEQVSSLLSSRTALVQEYDGGHLGRFDRHRIGLLMSMEHPLGIGPMVFSTIFPEDEHNIWLKSLTTYGWLGFATYVSMMMATIVMGFRYLLRDRPWQPFLMIAWIVIIGHVGIGNVIDTDHWRHFFLLLGIVWGCAALEQRYQRKLQRDHAG